MSVISTLNEDEIRNLTSGGWPRYSVLVKLAVEETKKGGDIERAKIYSTLAIAEAITNQEFVNVMH